MPGHWDLAQTTWAGTAPTSRPLAILCVEKITRPLFCPARAGGASEARVRMVCALAAAVAWPRPGRQSAALLVRHGVRVPVPWLSRRPP